MGGADVILPLQLSFFLVEMGPRFGWLAVGVG
jgi:hypothetical protein